MKFSRRRLAKQMVNLSTESKNTELIKQVAAYLITSKKANQASLLVNDVANELEITEGRVFATAISARKLSPSAVQSIKSVIKSQTKARDVVIDEQIDQSLIGGVVVQTPKYELDLSVKKQLNQIAAKGVEQ